MILVDSNILIDVLVAGQEWKEWSINQLSMRVVTDQLAINQVVVAEVAPRYASLDDFFARLASFEIMFEAMDQDSAFAAGIAFQSYRSKRSQAGSVLPDFFIGGHAKMSGATILTRDPRFYRAYFPTVPLITPSKDDQ